MGTDAATDGDIAFLRGYRAFLRDKATIAASGGFEIADEEIHPLLKPHQRAMIRWACRGGRRALFASFGLGKSLCQLEIVRLMLSRCGGRGLIVMPLGVRQEFVRDAAMIGTPVRFIRSTAEALTLPLPGESEPIYLTNYESVREGKLDPTGFTVVSLDESAILRGFGGTKTFRTFMGLFEGTSTYRFVATATPDPNEFIELLAYAAFLGVLDVGEGKTRFFKRDSTKADKLTLHPHKAREFWLWVATWALFVQKPSDICQHARLRHVAEQNGDTLVPCECDEGYTLPPLTVNWHEVPTDHSNALPERNGQGRLYKETASGVTEAAREKRDSLDRRITKMLELRAEDPSAHRIIWHDLEDERRAIAAAIPTAVPIYGTQDLDDREQLIIDFSDGKIQELAGKPSMLSAGCNFQRHCAWEIFLGIGFKFSQLIQGIHRVQRFLQPSPVRIDLIYTEAERSIRKTLEAKWARYTAQCAHMSALIREYGLADAALADALRRSLGVERREVSGDGYRLVQNDCVEETARMATNSVDLIVTSIPFSSQYEYTASFNDFGHSDSNEHFWQQMDYLSPHLLRVLRPGRIAAIHVKDRIAPGGLTGLGFQTLQPFHAEAIFHYQRHGFAFLGMKTIVTDVVRENNQTYRLGWSEQCKDGTRMGCGVPEYLLLFRKPPTDSSRGYADVPVLKDKPQTEFPDGSVGPYDYDGGKIVPGTGYSRARWQQDAHGFSRSSGDRLTRADEWMTAGLRHEQIYKRWRAESLSTVYDFERHVRLGEEMEREKRLPSTFMLMPPHSWHPDVWTDVARMRTLNMLQERKGQEFHLCPIQFDIVNRLLVEHSMKGEVIYDPFGGLMTVPYCAVKLGRYGTACELNARYFDDGVVYVESAARERETPTLFALEYASERATAIVVADANLGEIPG